VPGGSVLEIGLADGRPVYAYQEEKRGREAVLALGRIGTPLAVERLIDALDDPDPQVRWRASMALSRQGETVRPHLVARMARESDPEVREQLQDDLNRIGGKDG